MTSSSVLPQTQGWKTKLFHDNIYKKKPHFEASPHFKGMTAMSFQQDKWRTSSFSLNKLVTTSGDGSENLTITINKLTFFNFTKTIREARTPSQLNWKAGAGGETYASPLISFFSMKFLLQSPEKYSRPDIIPLFHLSPDRPGATTSSFSTTGSSANLE